MNDDPSPEDDLVKDLVNVAEAIAPLLGRFPNLRKVRDRLLGGGVFDAGRDAFKARMRLSETRSQVETIRILGESGLSASIVHELVSRQEALKALVGDALVRIAQDEEKNTTSTTETGTSSDVSDDEWFDVYRREAVDRSAGEMREAFVRVLEGEIRRPGAFSVQTLRVLGTISTDSAKKFRLAVSVCMWRESLPPDARIPAVGGLLGDNCLKDVGLTFDVLTQLTEDGLLRPNYSCVMPYGPVHEANPGVSLRLNAQFPFQHQRRKWVLVGTSDETKRKAISVFGAAFSTAGRELLKVAEIEQMPEFTERLKTHFAEKNYEMVEVSEDVDFYQ